MTVQALIKYAQVWALRKTFDLEHARALRHAAILQAHDHYLESIPVYRRLAKEEGIGRLDEITPIIQHLMLTDDIFKSYDQEWLDTDNFGQMNKWLSEIFHSPIEADVSGIDSIEGWIDCLDQQGVRVVYSSGTSGNFSFVPRDQTTWDRHVTTNTSYVASVVLEKKLGPLWQRLLLRTMLQLPHSALANTNRKMRLSDYDAVFLDFAHGRTGNQALEQQMAPYFHRHIFLYDTELSPSLLRLLVRGPKTEKDKDQLRQFQEEVIHRKEENYLKVIEYIRQSTKNGQKVFIFGTTMQYKELCELIAAHKVSLHLSEGSLAFFGGGWKSFAGEKISPERLVALMSESLDLAPGRILEGYSMTEINAFMLRCDHGRFHIPPTIEPVIFNDALEPVQGKDIRGVIGFLDPLAHSYPGFIISGDEVHYVEGECPCGRSGPAVTEIGRSRAREVKGCGGIMASIKA